MTALISSIISAIIILGVGVFLVFWVLDYIESEAMKTVALILYGMCFVVTIVVSLATRPRPESELEHLVYGKTGLPPDEETAWYSKPGFLAIVMALLCVILNLIFW